jgi:glutamate N-acetyltransferase/amino-acid N-acetyltransferase
MTMIKNITNVRGIKCWGAHTGIKSMRRDLAIIYSEVPASAAAVFTKNSVVAEPIKVSREHIKNGKAQAIVVNAGNANACTGQQGFEGAMAMAKKTAQCLNISTEDVIVSSTGLIGEPFPTEDIIAGIEENCQKLSQKSNAGSFVANAVLTTDTFAKEGFIEYDLNGYEINMGGVAKGSGMIHPNMGTMLGFIVTDVAIDSKLLQKTVKDCVDKSFNMITVDGDTSTNDMVVVLANGKAGNDELTSTKSEGFKVFKKQLEEMMIHLAKLIVSDGEGASKFVEYKVKGAKTEEIARNVVREISDSSLVKAAMFGRDPNWGRIICAAGNAGVDFDYTKADLYLGAENNEVCVLKQGVPQQYDKAFMKRQLRESQIFVTLDLNEGKKESTGWGSDLTTDYVLFNSVYTT